VGVAAVDRGGERLSRRAALCAAALLAAACRPPLAAEPSALFYLAFEGPPALPPTFKGGAITKQPADVWFCFTGMETYKLRDLDRWRAAEPAEQAPFFKAVCPDPILDTPGRLQALQWNDARENKLLLSDPVTGRYFFRVWFSR
jgi:hypothetical protein